jgi:RNA polymerase sigma-70 factor, ECF subfamily
MGHAKRETLRIMPDRGLVELAREGEQEAFAELVQRHRQKCVDLACYYLRNQGDAEDQAQNAILKAYQHLDQFGGEAEFATWLARIVANECLMLMRVQRRARFLYLDETPPQPKAARIQLPAPGPDPEGQLAFLQLVKVLRIEIRHIPHLLRKVVLLRDMEGLPMPDVANRLGITVSAAKSRLVRARAELRFRMNRHCARSAPSSALSMPGVPLNPVISRHDSAVAA